MLMNQNIFVRPGSIRSSILRSVWRPIRTLLPSALLAVFCISAQSKGPPKDSPVGHWIAEHPSKGGTYSWWDFRANGTLTVHVGAAMTSSITRSGDTFIAPAASADDPPVKVTYHVEGDTLHLTAPHIAEQVLTRVGPAPSASDPLLGKWKPIPPATYSIDIDVAAQQRAMASALFVFSADNTETVRAPYAAVEGNWDMATHTFTLRNQSVTFSFQRTGSKLTLSQPPDGKKTDTYILDPIL
jgi:hypothetical protein